MPYIDKVELDIDNITNDIYLKHIGKTLINIIDNSLAKNMGINDYDSYLHKTLFQYLNLRYYGFMDNHYANHILFSISKYKKSYPNIYEIIADPVLIFKK